MRKLKAGFVDRKGVDNRGFRQLDILVPGFVCETPRRQRKPADSLVLGLLLEEVIAGNQGVLRIDGVIKPRANIRVASRNQEALAELHDIESGIENRRLDQFVVIRLVAVPFEEERSLLLYDWSTYAAAKLTNLKRCALARTSCKRVA